MYSCAFCSSKYYNTPLSYSAPSFYVSEQVPVVSGFYGELPTSEQKLLSDLQKLIQNIVPQVEQQIMPLIQNLVIILYPYLKSNFPLVQTYLYNTISAAILRYTGSTMMTNMIMKVVAPMLTSILQKYIN